MTRTLIRKIYRFIYAKNYETATEISREDRAIETEHLNFKKVFQKVFVCSDTSDEGTGCAYGNFEINEDNETVFNICGMGFKPLSINLEPQSTKIKELWVHFRF